MEFANATYLWGWLGLLVPIAIHLWSRKKVVTIKVGSTKLLQASDPKQTSNLKLNELWLLFLRLLTVLLLVLILSEPSSTKIQEKSGISYVIEPSLLNDERMVSILDTVPEGSILLLEKGFSEWEGDEINAVGTPKYWQLAQEMHTIAADSIVVFSKGLIQGIQGRRPYIGANTKWIVFETDTDIETPITATQKEAYVQLLAIKSNSRVLFFKKDSIPLNSEDLEMNISEDSLRLKSSRNENWIPLQKNNPIRIGVIYEDSLKLQYDYVEAAYRAISKYLNRPLEMVVLKELNAQNTVNLNTIISFTNVIPKGSKASLLIFKPDNLANDLIENGPLPHVYYLTNLLNSENIVRQQLPEKLMSLLNRHSDLENHIMANDQRVLADAELQPMRSKFDKTKNKASVLKMTPWLWLFFLLVVVIERSLSKLRKQ